MDPAWLRLDFKKSAAESFLADRGLVEGDFIIRHTKGKDVLTCVYMGKVTHHQITSDEGEPVTLAVNGTPYPKCSNLNKLVKKLSKPNKTWPVVLAVAADDSAMGEEASPEPARKSKKKKKAVIDLDGDPFGGGGGGGGGDPFGNDPFGDGDAGGDIFGASEPVAFTPKKGLKTKDEDAAEDAGEATGGGDVDDSFYDGGDADDPFGSGGDDIFGGGGTAKLRSKTKRGKKKAAEPEPEPEPEPAPTPEPVAKKAATASPSPSSVAAKDTASAWLHGNLKKREADELLFADLTDGRFLVRSSKNHHVLSVVYKGKPTHHKIVTEDAGGVALNGTSYPSLGACITALGKKVDGWPVVLGGYVSSGSAPASTPSRPPRTSRLAESLSPLAEDHESPTSHEELSPTRKKKGMRDKTAEQSAGERQQMEDEAAAAILKLQSQLAEAQRAAEAEARADAKESEDAAKARGAGAGAKRKAREDKLKAAEASKIAEEEAAFADAAATDTAEAAAAKAAADQMAHQAAADAGRDKAEADTLLDGPIKKKKGKGKGKPLAGWRLKKAQRKAMVEAVEKDVPYDVYIADIYPELVGHPPPEAVEPQAFKPTAASAADGAATTMPAPTPAAAAALVPVVQPPNEEPVAHKAKKKSKKGEKEAVPPKPIPETSSTEPEPAPAPKPEPVADAEATDTADAKRKRKKKKKKKKQVEEEEGEEGDKTDKTAPDATAGQVDVTDNATDDATVAAVPVSTPQETKKPAPKKNGGGGFFGGWFAAAEPVDPADEEEKPCPDHDNDETGKPLNRIELLRRTNRRANNLKIREAKAARAAAEAAAGDAAVATDNDSNASDGVASEAVSPSPPPISDTALRISSDGDMPTVPEESGDEDDDVDDDIFGSQANGAFKAPKADRSKTTQPRLWESDKKVKSSARATGKLEVIAFDGSSDSEADDTDDTDAAAARRGGGRSGGTFSPSIVSGMEIAVDSSMISELLRTVAELKDVTGTMKTQISSLNQELANVKADLSVMKARAAAGTLGSEHAAASGIYAWHQFAIAEPQVFYAKLSDRKIELQKQAQPGIQDPTQKDAWQKEWTVLSSELDTVSAKLAEGTGANDGTVSAAGDMLGLAAASKVSFSLLVFGGRVGTLDATGYLERYDVDSKTWISLAPLPTERFGIAAGTLLGYVYVVAGSGIDAGAKPTGAMALQAGGAAGAGAKNVCSLNLVERYDPVANKWEEVAKCSATRAGLAAAVLNEHVYVVGGASDALFGSVILSSAEKYNPRDNTWRSISPMNTKRAGLSVAAVDGHLYAMGGYDQNVKCLNSVERYDPQTNSWATVASMASARARLAVAVIGASIYAIGGYDGTARSRTVERYDVTADSWTTVAPMRQPRDYLGASAVDGMIYAIGGFNGSERLNTVEAYLPEKDVWVDVPRMQFPRDGLCVVGLDMVAVGPTGGSSASGGSPKASDPANASTMA